MSWIAEYDTRGREFPTCVHVTKTTGFMTHGTTYVPIEDGKAVRDENAKLRELCARMFKDFVSCDCELRARAGRTFMAFTRYALELQELGIEVGG